MFGGFLCIDPLRFVQISQIAKKTLDKSSVLVYNNCTSTDNTFGKGVVFLISIDVTGRVPIYEQIYRTICGEISKGVLKENDKLTSSRALAMQLGLNPNTVAKAYQMLERDGIIYTVAGKGSFIANANGKANSALTKDFEEKAREALKAGVPPQTLIDIIETLKGESL